jgi:hypothetical protein
LDSECSALKRKKIEEMEVEEIRSFALRDRREGLFPTLD